MKKVEALQDNCKTTFEAVYREWYPKLFSFILSKTQSEEFAEEVVQHTFVRLWERRDGLSLKYSIEVQLFRMARTILIDELRKAAHARKYMDQTQSESSRAEQGDHIIDYRESLSRIKNAIDNMPPVRRKVFQMSRFEELSYAEISKELKISPRTVENHISLALKHLKKVFLFILAFLLGVF